MKSKPIILFALALLLNILLLHGQTRTNTASRSRVVRMENFFNCYGVIFDSSYKSPIVINSLAGRFTPDDADITVAEKVFIEQYNAANQEYPGTKDAAVINNVKKFFRKFNRQYIGYVDRSGNKNIIIHLFDYSNRRIVRKYVGEGWRSSLVIIFAEDMPFSIHTYRVNLKNEKLHVSF